MSSFYKEFDTILAAICADYQNQIPDADLSAGSLLKIKSACLASALWGIYKYQDFLARQIFPHSAEPEFLQKHAETRGIVRLAGESDASLLERLLNDLRHPPAGGNRYDWPMWARSVSYTHDVGQPSEWTERASGAWYYENVRGDGSINVVVTSNRTAAGYEEIPTAALIEAVRVYCDEKRPLGIWDFIIVGATRKVQDVVITVEGVSAPVRALIASDIQAYIKSLAPAKTLHLSQLSAKAIDRGATTATVTTPEADVTMSPGPWVYERAWPGNVVVTG